MASWLPRNIFGAVASSTLTPARVRLTLLRMLGANLGDCAIRSGVQIFGDPANLSIGDGCFLNVGVKIFPSGGVRIDRNVAIGPYSILITGTHKIGPTEKRASSPSVFEQVTIGEGAWLGAGVIVQGGVSIGRGAVIAAGSVVNRDVEPDTFYAGVPARKKRDLS